MEINPNEVYTTSEVQSLLKNKLIQANKVGGHYRVMGKELLRIVSPRIEKKVVATYQRLKKKVKRKIKTW